MASRRILYRLGDAATRAGKAMRDPTSILITGASSGIGAALARHYARPGTRLALCGRDAARLAAVVTDCRARGAEVASRQLDIADRAATRDWIAEIDDARALDLVVANAGISLATSDPAAVDRVVRQTFAVNVDGVFNTFNPALERMTARGRGQLAVISSLAGFRGMASSPAYSASKAAVRAYGEAMRGFAARYGVEVSVVCPGFVRSRLTATNRFPMPFLMDADRAARIIAKGLERDRGRIAFPLPMYLAVWLLAALPDRLVDRLTRMLPDKT